MPDILLYYVSVTIEIYIIMLYCGMFCVMLLYPTVYSVLSWPIKVCYILMYSKLLIYLPMYPIISKYNIFWTHTTLCYNLWCSMIFDCILLYSNIFSHIIWSLSCFRFYTIMDIVSIILITDVNCIPANILLPLGLAIIHASNQYMCLYTFFCEFLCIVSFWSPRTLPHASLWHLD